MSDFVDEAKQGPTMTDGGGRGGGGGQRKSISMADTEQLPGMSAHREFCHFSTLSSFLLSSMFPHMHASQSLPLVKNSHDAVHESLKARDYTLTASLNRQSPRPAADNDLSFEQLMKQYRDYEREQRRVEQPLSPSLFSFLSLSLSLSLYLSFLSLSSLSHLLSLSLSLSSSPLPTPSPFLPCILSLFAFFHCIGLQPVMLNSVIRSVDPSSGQWGASRRGIRRGGRGRE
jgi:hypothetical protein